MQSIPPHRRVLHWFHPASPSWLDRFVKRETVMKKRIETRTWLDPVDSYLEKKRGRDERVEKPRTYRTAQEVAKLTYRDMLELLTMKSQWKRDLEKRMAERDLKESETNQVNTAPYNVPEICT
ncbi:hypothetical protein G6F53_007031 [Rhizopus delemar]|nr:hypothetical protein G6F53_007031 [Rhizopus delemar]